MRKAWWVVVLVAGAGCLQGPAREGADRTGPAPAVEAPEEAAKVEASPTPSVERVLQGVILARAPGTGPIPAEGDEASFCFSLPEGSTLLRGNLTWDPPQQMGLQFRHDNQNHASWEGGAIARLPPIVLEVEAPGSGSWWSYAGPGVAGGAVAWQLVLTVVGSPGSEPWDGVVYPEGSRFDDEPPCAGMP